ncbi:peptidoglycan-binding domain-containing protein [Arhodomonas sp. SL1]|uniref:peptidoglycan-binding domain-containing protein n=1 Tax=Arhodomonas sp. SL1 TaxID=3425691 RepID=UPI003F882CB4
MRNRWKGSVAVAAVALALMAPAAPAADGEGNYAVRGPGTQPCSRLAEAVEAGGPALAAFATWMDGYLSARNRTGEETFDVSPIAGTGPMIGVVRNICQANPEASVETATARVLELLTPYRVERRSPMVELELGDASTEVRRATLALVQRRLAAEGFYDGDASGDYNSATRRAIQRYQEERDLAVTGLPDSDTVLWLIRDAEQSGAQ